LKPALKKLLVVQVVFLVVAGVGFILFFRASEADQLREVAHRFAEQLAARQFESAVEEFTLPRERARIGIEVSVVRRELRRRFVGSDPIPEEERARIVAPPNGRDLLADLRWLEAEVRLERDFPEYLPVVEILMALDGPDLEENVLDSARGRERAAALATRFLVHHLETACLGLDLARLEFAEILGIEPDRPEGAPEEAESEYDRAIVRFQDEALDRTFRFHQRRLHYGEDIVWYIDLSRWYRSTLLPGSD
jgi:hypothetical protein